MTLETSITELTDQASLLMDLPTQIATAAETQIGRVADRYDDILASQVLSVFVDQENGSDNNAGTEGEPFSSIVHAINITPRGGLLKIELKTDYHIDQKIRCDGRHVYIHGQNNILKTLTFQPYTGGSGASTYRALNGFHVGDGGSMCISYCRLVMPAVTGYGQFSLSASSPFNNAYNWGLIDIIIRNSEIVIPASPFGYFFSSNNEYRVRLFSVSYPGTITSPLGRLFAAQTNTAGVDTVAVQWLITNLTQI